ncbi:hypothetical protein Tco_0674512 [Tanacetum coccineum]
MDEIPHGVDTKENLHFNSFWMLSLSLHVILHFSSLRMSLKCTCTSFGISCTSMTPSIDSRLTRRNDSSLVKRLQIYFQICKVVQDASNLVELLTVFIKPELSERIKVLKASFSELKSFRVLYLQIAQEIPEASPTKKDSDLVLIDEEPVTKGKQVKRSFKKSSTKPTTSIVIKEPLVETKSKGKEKEKEKVDVAHGKGIELLSEIALTEKAQLKEGCDVTEDDSTESESESWGNDEDDSNNEQEASDESSGQENESEEQESNSKQDEESDDDNQEEEDVGNENLVTTQEQVVDDAHVTITTVTKKTEVPVTSSSRSSDLASKFLIFLDIPQTDAEIVSPLDVHVHHEVPRTQVPTLLTIPEYVITESSPVLKNIPQSSQTFTPTPILTTPTPPPTIETTNPLSTLLDFVWRNQEKKYELPFRGLYGKNQRASKKEQVPQILPKENLPQDQEGNLGDNEDEPRNATSLGMMVQEPTHSRTHLTLDGILQDYSELSRFIFYDIIIEGL